LHTFCTQEGNCLDGGVPEGPLVQSSNGNFLGTTEQGGVSNAGTVFEISPSGRLTSLYSFCAHANCGDGDGPVGQLVQGIDGAFYGTTLGGGANRAGTVFRITPGGRLSVLHSFCADANCTDGAGPTGLVLGTDGNLYGTTFEGGTSSACD